MIRVFCFLLWFAAGFAKDSGTFCGEGIQKLSAAISDFSMDLMKVTSAGEDDNVLMSPASIGLALSVLQQGAKGTTAEDLQKVLRVPADEQERGYSSLIPCLREEKKNVSLEWGNGIYVKEGFALEENFKNVVQEKFQSKIEGINFTVPSKEEAATKINQWISDVTHDQIKNVIEPVLLNEDTVMVLVNGIYFKGVWDSVFDASMTRPYDFEISPGNSTLTPFMRQDESFPAGEDPTLGIKWLELPYQDDQFSMIFILPDEKHGLSKVIEKLTGADLRRIISNTERRLVKVTVPKFNLQWKSSLQTVLEQLGLRDLFTTNANLEGISSTHQDLKVSQLVHQANMEIDEDGTTAAAASYEFVQVLSLLTHPDEMIFYADHPFLAFVVDKKNEIPLFAAKIKDPSSKLVS